MKRKYYRRFYGSRPFIYNKGNLYLGEPNTFHIDLAEDNDLTHDWMFGLCEVGRVYENEHKLPRYIQWHSNTPPPLKLQIEQEIQGRYGCKQQDCGISLSKEDLSALND